MLIRQVAALWHVKN